MRDKLLIAHTSPTTIRDIVKEFHSSAKEDVKSELQNHIKQGKQFAATFDEWTGRNRRYLTINLHISIGDFINLGMIRVWAGQTAETILKLVTTRLSEYI